MEVGMRITYYQAPPPSLAPAPLPLCPFPAPSPPPPCVAYWKQVIGGERGGVSSAGLGGGRGWFTSDCHGKVMFRAEAMSDLTSLYTEQRPVVSVLTLGAPRRGAQIEKPPAPAKQVRQRNS